MWPLILYCQVFILVLTYKPVVTLASDVNSKDGKTAQGTETTLYSSPEHRDTKTNLEMTTPPVSSKLFRNSDNQGHSDAIIGNETEVTHPISESTMTEVNTQSYSNGSNDDLNSRSDNINVTITNVTRDLSDKNHIIFTNVSQVYFTSNNDLVDNTIYSGNVKYAKSNITKGIDGSQRDINSDSSSSDSEAEQEIKIHVNNDVQKNVFKKVWGELSIIKPLSAYQARKIFSLVKINNPDMNNKTAYVIITDSKAVPDISNIIPATTTTTTIPTVPDTTTSKPLTPVTSKYNADNPGSSSSAEDDSRQSDKYVEIEVTEKPKKRRRKPGHEKKKTSREVTERKESSKEPITRAAVVTTEVPTTLFLTTPATVGNNTVQPFKINFQTLDEIAVNNQFERSVQMLRAANTEACLKLFIKNCYKGTKKVMKKMAKKFSELGESLMKKSLKKYAKVQCLTQFMPWVSEYGRTGNQAMLQINQNDDLNIILTKVVPNILESFSNTTKSTPTIVRSGRSDCRACRPVVLRAHNLVKENILRFDSSGTSNEGGDDEDVTKKSIRACSGTFKVSCALLQCPKGTKTMARKCCKKEFEKSC